METDALSFWNKEFYSWFHQNAYQFGVVGSCPYPFYEIRRDHVLKLAAEMKCGRVLDIGCGGAHVLSALLDSGWNGEGCDFAPNMVAYARDRLKILRYENIRIQQQSATSLGGYDDGTFDLVLCLGPLEYMTDEEVIDAYAEIRRILKPNGTVISAHINTLFDFFTLDRFTTTNIIAMLEKLEILTDTELEGVRHSIEHRLEWDSSGKRFDEGPSIRNSLQTRSDNPLTISKELCQVGFRSEDIIFYRFYCAPPFAAREQTIPETMAIQLENVMSRDWRGHFLASSFLSVSRRM